MIPRAERIEPPLEFLHDPANLVVLGKVEEVDTAAARVVFERKELLAGQAALAKDDEIEVIVPHEAIGKIVVGKSYVFGYTRFAPDPRRPGKLVAQRQGATLLVAPGLEPALFEDTPALRQLLRLSREEDEAEESRELLDALLHALSEHDLALQDLAANELALASGLRHQLGVAERETMKRFVRDSSASALGRMALLEAAASDPKSYGESWALDTAAQILSATPTVGFVAETSDREALVRTALLLFDQSATVGLPPSTLQRWLRSDSLALVEPTVRMLERQSTEAARDAIGQAQEDRATPPRTRAFLREHLQRLDAARARRGTSG